MSIASESLVAVRGLSKRFPVDWDWRGRETSWLWAVDYVDLDLFAGETLAIVGESGCGKSTLARLMFQLLPATSGSVRLGRLDVLAAKGDALLEIRRRMQLIFQDPNGSLDPRKTVAAALDEGVARLGLTQQERRARADEALDLVGLPASAMQRLPGELSGGERQRVAIARALAVKPSVLVLDEPVSSLDPSVQALVLNLLVGLQGELGLTYVFISHDLSVVRHIADRVAVMYLGQIVECAPTEALFDHPRHPYTHALLSAIPSISSATRSLRIAVRGEPGTAVDPEAACRFAGRCVRVGDRCNTEVPAFAPVSDDARRMVACFHPIPNRTPPGALQLETPVERRSAPAEGTVGGRPSVSSGFLRGAAPYVAFRLGRATLLLFASSILVFAGLAATSNSGPLSAQDGSSSVPDQPFITRYVVFIEHLLTGSWGDSSASGAPISHIIATAGLNTLELGLAALLLVYLFALPLGLLAARRQASLTDQGIRLFTLIGMGIPNFFLAALLIQFVSLRWHWLPDAGSGGLSHLVLPAIALSLEALAINIRLTRSAVLDEIRKDYVRALRARGLRARRVLWRHVLRNALPPVVAYAGTLVPLILGYTIIIEVMFRFEGLGYELVESIINQDYLLAQTLALVFAAVVIGCNLLAELGNLLLAPQTRKRIRST